MGGNIVGVVRCAAAAAGTWCGVGLQVPLAPAGVSVLAVILVRAIVWTRTKSIGWNVAVMGLATLAALVTVEGSHISVFRGFWLGVGYGALGVGIIEVGKSAMGRALTERFANAASVLFGVKPRE